MAGFSRKTHIVRVSMDDPPTPAGEQPSSYVDIEVIDAISFRDARGEEMVFDMAAASALPYIVDNAGGGHGASPDNATRRSHMKRLTSTDDPTVQIDVEVIDVVAFRGKNGEEWILDMSGTADDPKVFDVTTGAGGTTATRRVHDEKISSDLTDPNPTSYLNVERSDSIAFRTVFGHEMIVLCPSNDDPLSSSPRAATVTTPQGYNPQDTSDNAVIPPSPVKAGDKSVYLARVTGSSDFMTNAAKLQQGPFWWVRSVSPGGQWLVLTISAGANSNSTTPPGFPEVTFDFGDNPDTASASLLSRFETTDTSTTPAGQPTFVYFVWNNVAPFPTLDTYGSTVVAVPPIPYFAQFARLVNINDNGFSQPRPNLPGGDPDYPDGQYEGQGQFASLLEAQQYAARFNMAYTPPPTENFTDYLAATGGGVHLASGVPAQVFAAQLVLPSTDNGSATSSLVGTYGIKIPRGLESFSVNVSNPGVATTGNITSKIGALGGLGAVGGTPSPPADDDVLGASSTASGGTTYTVETQVLTDPIARVHIVITGGNTSGGGGGAR